MSSSLCVLLSVFREKSRECLWPCGPVSLLRLREFLSFCINTSLLPLPICSVDMHAFLTEAAKSFPLLPQTHCLSCSASTWSVKYIFSAYKSKVLFPTIFSMGHGGNLVFFHITRCEIQIFLSTVYWMTFLSLSPFFVFAFFKYLKVKESKNLVSKIKHLELGLECTCRKPLSKF